MSDKPKRQLAVGRDAMRRGGGLRRLPDLLGRVLDPASRRRGLAEARVLTDWPSIVGEVLAARCQPVKLTGGSRGHGGILHIHVAGSAALELQHSEPQLLERINSYFGYPAVARLRLIRAPLALPRRAPAAAVAAARCGGARRDRSGRAARRGRRATRRADRAWGDAEGAAWSSSTEREARVMARAFWQREHGGVGAATVAAPARSPHGRLRERGRQAEPDPADAARAGARCRAARRRRRGVARTT